MMQCHQMEFSTPTNLPHLSVPPFFLDEELVVLIYLLQLPFFFLGLENNFAYCLFLCRCMIKTSMFTQVKCRLNQFYSYYQPYMYYCNPIHKRKKIILFYYYINSYLNQNQGQQKTPFNPISKGPAPNGEEITFLTG